MKSLKIQLKDSKIAQTILIDVQAVQLYIFQGTNPSKSQFRAVSVRVLYDNMHNHITVSVNKKRYTEIFDYSKVTAPMPLISAGRSLYGCPQLCLTGF